MLPLLATLALTSAMDKPLPTVPTFFEAPYRTVLTPGLLREFEWSVTPDFDWDEAILSWNIAPGEGAT